MTNLYPGDLLHQRRRNEPKCTGSEITCAPFPSNIIFRPILNNKKLLALFFNWGFNYIVSLWITVTKVRELKQISTPISFFVEIKISESRMKSLD